MSAKRLVLAVTLLAIALIQPLAQLAQEDGKRAEQLIAELIKERATLYTMRERLKEMHPDVQAQLKAIKALEEKIKNEERNRKAKSPPVVTVS